MQGNQLLHPQHRVLLAASLFALGAGILFLVAWQWPRIQTMFHIAKVEEVSSQGFTEEEKMQILRELQQSSAESAHVTEAQQDAAIKSLAASQEPDESGFTEEQKLGILKALNAN